MVSYPAAMPHSELSEVFPDVFFVTGTSRPSFGGMDWQFSRNMVVVRDGRELTLVNTVRLDDEALKRLDELGRVAHIVKLGAFHGMDDAFYRARYGARQWALPGMRHEENHASDEELVPSGRTPFAPVSVFSYETSAMPEGLLLIERNDGILVSCDSLQNWAAADRFFDEESSLRMTAMGFIQPANIGPGWRASCKPQASDFARVKALAFRHLLPAHGTPLLDEALDRFSATFKREFEV